MHIDTSVGNEKYVPSSRDARVAYVGSSDGVLRTQCVTCCDAHPLAHAEPVYGLDLRCPLDHEGLWIGDELIAAAHDPRALDALINNEEGWTEQIRCYESDPNCATCGVSILALSARLQREHEDQQWRWSRTAPSTGITLIECGVSSQFLGKVY